jgi:glycosyltransferase involved in cell wall biosynthesis
MKILLITPTSGQVIGFRAKLIEKLQNRGDTVSVLTFDDINKAEILKRGIDFHFVKDKNRGQNPFRALTLTNRYCTVIKQISPDVVFTFMLKPNTFGVMAAKRAGVKRIFSMVEGAGDVFANDGLKWKAIRAFVCMLYKRAFKNSRVVFFLNNDDRAEFVKRGLVKDRQCQTICGIGIDLEQFEYIPPKNQRTFLMVARMLKTKGVFEYCQAARIVKQRYPDAVFWYLGAEGTVSLSDIKEYLDDGSVSYLGTAKDTRQFYADCTASILPSYREGFSFVNMEAAATGRPIITSDANGTRDACIDGVSGFVVPVKNAHAIAQKVIWCIEHPEETIQMGINSRKYAEENFDQRKINETILNVLDKESQQQSARQS